MTASVQLYAMPISHWCVSADRMLAFKGIPFESLYVAYHDKEDLIAATGQDYVPTIMWDDRAVMWYDIPDFLEGEVPEPPLYPNGWRGVAVALERWGHAVVEEAVWRYVVTKVPPVLRDDHERWVFEEMQVKARGPWHVLEARRDEFREGMMEELGRIETMLEGKEWILEAPSLADFGVFGSLSPLLTVGEEVPAELPNLVAWADRIRGIGG
ncbi:MAG: glutathione S-transferase family protein [Candidatus Thermoplasmatota archaeon]|nr:glutathione S-transferase family protein [Candidatus Thermoplasmatota archaeon]